MIKIHTIYNDDYGVVNQSFVTSLEPLLLLKFSLYSVRKSLGMSLRIIVTLVTISSVKYTYNIQFRYK